MVRAHSLIAGTLNPDEDYPVPTQFGGSDFLPGDDLEEIIQALILELDLSDPGPMEPGAAAAVRQFVAETFKDTSIDSITVEHAGKKATVRRHATVQN